MPKDDCSSATIFEKQYSDFFTAIRYTKQRVRYKLWNQIEADNSALFNDIQPNLNFHSK